MGHQPLLESSILAFAWILLIPEGLIKNSLPPPCLPAGKKGGIITTRKGSIVL
jgi:hypothetical protein